MSIIEEFSRTTLCISRPFEYAPEIGSTAQLELSVTRWNNSRIIIGDRLRALREEKKLSQGDIEKRTGLVRPYISRVENNHTIPNIETLEKWARALEVPMYQLFYDGDEPPTPLKLPKRKSDGSLWAVLAKRRDSWANFAICWQVKRGRPQALAAHYTENGPSLVTILVCPNAGVESLRYAEVALARFFP